MRITATTNPSSLDALIDASEAIGSPEQIRREAEASVDMVESLYVQGFEREEAPNGSAWADPKHDYGHPLMRDTRALQRGAAVTAEIDGVLIVVDQPHAHYHQGGTSKMEAREIVPDDELGERWDGQIGLARASAPPRLP